MAMSTMIIQLSCEHTKFLFLTVIILHERLSCPETVNFYSIWYATEIGYKLIYALRISYPKTITGQTENIKKKKLKCNFNLVFRTDVIPFPCIFFILYISFSTVTQIYGSMKNLDEHFSREKLNYTYLTICIKIKKKVLLINRHFYFIL